MLDSNVLVYNNIPCVIVRKCINAKLPQTGIYEVIYRDKLIVLGLLNYRQETWDKMTESFDYYEELSKGLQF